MTFWERKEAEVAKGLKYSEGAAGGFGNPNKGGGLGGGYVFSYHFIFVYFLGFLLVF